MFHFLTLLKETVFPQQYFLVSDHAREHEHPQPSHFIRIIPIH